MNKKQLNIIKERMIQLYPFVEEWNRLCLVLSQDDYSPFDLLFKVDIPNIYGKHKKNSSRKA